MACVTISGLYNEQAYNFAKNLTKQLKFYFVDKNLLDEIMRDFGYTNFLMMYEKDPGILFKIDTERELQKEIAFFNQVVLAIAKNYDVVFIGSGINLVLLPFADVLNLKLYASDEFLIDDISRNENIDKILAKKKVNVQIKEEVRFIKSFYGNKIKSEKTNDLSCNIEKVGISWLSNVLNKIIKNIRKEKELENVKINPVLLETVNDIFKNLVPGKF